MERTALLLVLTIPLALQERSTPFKHKYISFFGIVTPEGKAHVLSKNRWQSAFAVEGRVVGQTLYLRT